MKHCSRSIAGLSRLVVLVLVPFFLSAAQTAAATDVVVVASDGDVTPLTVVTRASASAASSATTDRIVSEAALGANNETNEPTNQLPHQQRDQLESKSCPPSPLSCTETTTAGEISDAAAAAATRHDSAASSSVVPASAAPARNEAAVEDDSPLHPATGATTGAAPEDDFWKPRPSDVDAYAGELDDDDEDEVDEDDNEDIFEADGDFDETDDDLDEYEYDDNDNDNDDDDDDDEDEEDIPAPRELQQDNNPSDDVNFPPPSDPASDLGEPQVYPAPMEGPVREILDRARTYLRDVVGADEFYAPVRALCHNKDPSCAAWAAQGECAANPRFMNVTCAPMCRTCEMLHASTRCQLDPNAPSALSDPGDLDRLFERIVNDPVLVARHQIQVLSRPDYAPGDSLETADYQLGLWLIQLDGFASPEECERLIELGQLEGYVRSADVGDELEDGTFTDDINSGRTSMNSWCGNACTNDPHAQAVMERMANVTGIPEANQEHLQLLRYEVGQFYQTHNDYIPYQVFRPVGPRILTFYLYLQDVASGGETDFPRLGLKVAPKQGRAVLWPSVLNSHPDLIDPRSDHQALPVLEGVKYGANAWIHQRAYKPVSDESDGVCT